jgi:hypothetical protein
MLLSKSKVQSKSRRSHCFRRSTVLRDAETALPRAVLQNFVDDNSSEIPLGAEAIPVQASRLRALFFF